MSAGDGPHERRGPGRPRKWATEAERVRAYRQRKAEEHANVDGLRLERRTLKRQLSDAIRGRARAEADLERAKNCADRLEADLARTQERLHSVEAEVGWLRSKNEPVAAQHNPDALVTSREPGPSRQERRAIERTKRKRGR